VEIPGQFNLFYQALHLRIDPENTNYSINKYHVHFQKLVEAGYNLPETLRTMILLSGLLLESCNSGSTPELPELRVLDGTLASAYVLRPCCRSCSVFQRCRRQIEKERRRGVILVDIQAKVHSRVSTSLYTEVKAD